MPQQGKIATKQQRNYGAVTVTDDQHNQLRDEFHPDTTYYLKESQNWNAGKILLLLFPLCGAAVIIGGAVWYLIVDFNHLYPGSRHFESHATSNSVKVSAPEKDTLQNVTRSSKPLSEENKFEKIKSLQTISANCSFHSACSNLTGDCCPSPEGVLLECCSR